MTSQKERIERLVIENRKLKRMARLANGVMEYCSGDEWEQEATKKNRDLFNKLHREVFGEEGDA